jgi:hypothetical protein
MIISKFSSLVKAIFTINGCKWPGGFPEAPSHLLHDGTQERLDPADVM